MPAVRIPAIASLLVALSFLSVPAAPVFASREDRDFQKLREIVHHLAGDLREKTWCHMDRFLPNPHYVREMKRYGVLEADWEMGDPLEAFELENRYFKLFWHKPRENW